MYKFKKIQVLTVDKVYQLCNEYQWFTKGDCKQYEMMFSKVSKLPKDRPLTESKVFEIAFIIAMFSDTPSDYNTQEFALSIMSTLYNEAVKTIYTEVFDK